MPLVGALGSAVVAVVALGTTGEAEASPAQSTMPVIEIESLIMLLLEGSEAMGKVEGLFRVSCVCGAVVLGVR